MRQTKAEVIQVIPWEKRKEYCYGYDWPAQGEYDLINMRKPDDKEKYSTIQRLINQLPFVHVGPKFHVDNDVEYDYFVMWAKRPHNFKEGDLVDVIIIFAKNNVDIEQELVSSDKVSS